MLSFYTDLKISYYITASGGALVWAILFSSWGLSAAYCLLLLPWILLCAAVFIFLTQRRLNKLNNQRTEQCIVRPFMQFYDSALYKPAVEKNVVIRNIVLINLAAGYINLGYAQRALDRLQQVQLRKIKNTNDAQTAIIYHNNLAAAYLELHNTDAAQGELAEMERLLDTVKLPELLRNQYRQIYSRNRAALTIEQGQYEGAELMLQTLLDAASSMLTKVEAYEQLAAVYLATDQLDKARECLSFAVQHGGDTIYAARSAKKLQELEKTIPTND